MGANFMVKLEQHVGWADQPILMESIEFDSLSIVENFGTSNQGDVMVMDDIKRFLKNLLDP
jgi:hypothetical protein